MKKQFIKSYQFECNSRQAAVNPEKVHEYIIPEQYATSRRYFSPIWLRNTEKCEHFNFKCQ